MKKSIIVLIVIIAIIALVIISFIGKYNKLVTLQEKVENSSANIDTMLQRRADLIPNLVSTVKGFSEHENEVIDKITTARAAMTGNNSTEDKLKANDELNSALKELFVIVENYPVIQSSANFVQLQDELAGSENRIAVARKDYNDAVKELNAAIKKFPNNILAGMFNIEKANYYEAAPESTAVPVVEF